LSETIRELVRRRVARAVLPFLSRISGVKIVLEQSKFLSIPLDHHCWVTLVSARTQQPLVVHGLSSDIRGAVRKATRRLRVALAREVLASRSARGWRLDRAGVASVDDGDPPSHVRFIRQDAAWPRGAERALPRGSRA
jgi:hypothetical protein